MIYDANNGRRAQRQTLAEKFDKAGIHVVMLGAFVTFGLHDTRDSCFLCCRDVM